MKLRNPICDQEVSIHMEGKCQIIIHLHYLFKAIEFDQVSKETYGKVLIRKLIHDTPTQLEINVVETSPNIKIYWAINRENKEILNK